MVRQKTNNSLGNDNHTNKTSGTDTGIDGIDETYTYHTKARDVHPDKNPTPGFISRRLTDTKRFVSVPAIVLLWARHDGAGCGLINNGFNSKLQIS